MGWNGLLAVALALALAAPDGHAQSVPGIPPRDLPKAAAAKGSASIRGRITAAGANAPLRRAQVVVTAADGISRYTTTTHYRRAA